MDYIPLATMLATGQLAEADQVRKLYFVCNKNLWRWYDQNFFFFLPLTSNISLQNCSF
jgi:hypothetical protein